jgi:hypothetical protein
MSNKKIVYWSPVFFDSDVDWNMMYYDLVSLYDYHKEDMNRDVTPKGNSFFFCPAFKNIAKNTFIALNPIHSHFIFEDGVAKVKTKNHILIDIDHSPSIINNSLIRYGLQYIFFSESDINLTVTDPYFNRTSHAAQCKLVPGRININKWFRVINLEYNLWADVNELEFEKEEPLAYFSFDSDNVELVRFKMSNELMKLSESCSTSTTWETQVPIIERYNRFVKTRTNNLVLNEIKKNLI